MTNNSNLENSSSENANNTQRRIETVIPFENKLRNYAKDRLSTKKIIFLKNLYASTFINNNLKKLAVIYGTDKWNQHYYAQHYETHFQQIRRKKLNILEIGIGGYKNPKAGGGSLRMWRTYFPNSMIYGLDIHDKKFHEEKRIKTFQGSQNDQAFLEKIAATIGSIDIVIDDGSHINDHVITTFEILFPLLNKNGIYVVEDTQTSYVPSLGGTDKDLNLTTTIMGYFKSLTDGLNYEEYITDYTPNYMDKHIISMHFYHNLIFIYKGQNNEGSNLQGKYKKKIK